MQDFSSISELTLAVKKHLESKFLALSVRGEISNFKEQSSGHLYFTLKDEQAQISAVLFKGNAASLKRLPKNGDQVVVKGELSVYPPRGNYQIIIRELQYAGVGELLLKFHQLKMKLQEKGWFSLEHKKLLPPFPRTIGVITSPSGAVIQDILNILRRRFSGFHLILNPVRVQGEGAAQEIAAAIEQFNRFALADVLIVGRGGGSLEDLWAFNEECVAEAIFTSKIPIISAVGHETDVSIADYVADVRAPTPSAAAELVVAEKKHQLDFLERTHKQLSLVLQAKVHQEMQHLDDIGAALDASIRQKISDRRLRVAGLQKQAKALNPSSQLPFWRAKLLSFEKGLQTALQQRIARRKEKLSFLISHLRAIDPKNLLTKGYCIPFAEKEDSVILSVKELQVNQNLRLLLHDGRAIVKTTEINHGRI